MVADAALPVWTIRPNWSDGITERLAWLTDVIDANDGNEQRRAMRLSPRREFEVTFNPTDEIRSYFDLWLHRMGAQEFMLPLFHDRAKLTADMLNGAVVVPIKTAYREFVAGGMVLILGDTPHDYDARTILSVTANSITLTAGVSRAWPKGASVHPLRRSRLSQESGLGALTNRVGQSTLVFQLNQANDLPAEGDWTGFPTYDGLPVMTLKPDYSETLDMSFMRLAEVLDNDHGLNYLVDDAGRAFTTQAHTFDANTLAERDTLRKMLYRLRGRQQAVWLPTFNQDIRLARPAVAANAYVHVKKLGYAYTGGAKAGRSRILINGTTPAQISGTGAALAPQEERLNLSAPLGANYPAGAVASFLDAARLEQDTVEIHHHTDTISRVATVFKTFKNTRVAPTILSAPIPAAVKGAVACGVRDTSEDPCVKIVSFEGWWLKIRFYCDLGIPPYSFPAHFINGDMDNNGTASLGEGGVSYTDPQTGGHSQVDYYYGIDGRPSYWEYTFWASKFATDFTRSPRAWWLEAQWNVFAWDQGGSDLNKGVLMVRRWDESDFTPVAPTNTQEKPSPYLGIQRLFPRDYYFYF